MNSKGLMRFHNKECKQNRHSDCAKQWEGFGFIVICNCNCHQYENEADRLAQVWDPDANISYSDPSSKEGIQEDDIQ